MKKILIVAGETSADLHGANLISALKSAVKEDLKVFGLGGAKMRTAGVELLADITAYAGTGLDPLRNISRFTGIFRRLVHSAQSEKPDIAILIDFPDFNLRLAKRLKQHNIRVVYYISPQVWAWRRSRINLIRKYVDKMIVLFEFEQAFYKQHGMTVDWVGHPLLDVLGSASADQRAEARKNIGLPDNGLIIGLLPGSRLNEFRRHFPVILKASAMINQVQPAKYIMGAAPNITEQVIAPYLSPHLPAISVCYNRTYDIIRAADLLIAVSGTVCLESAIIGTPMVIIYKVSLLTELILGPLVNMDYYSIVNIIAGKEVVPELMQRRATPQRIADRAGYLLQPGKLAEVRQGLDAVRGKLGTAGASIRAARIIAEML